MKKTVRTCCILFLFMVSGSSLFAQKAISIGKVVNRDSTISLDDIHRVKSAITISDTLVGWKFNWTGALKGTQAAYSNWPTGGVNTISVTGASIFNALYREGLFAYALSVDLKYGLSYIGGQGKRKINDKLAINNRFTYLFGADSLWTAFANINFTTQFDQGYNYLEVSYEHQNILSERVYNNRELISEFMAPAYFSQIVGLGYLPTPYLTFTAGLALKETFVLNDSLTTIYGLPPGQNIRFEPGFSLGIQFEKNLMENVHILASLESFTNIKRPLERTDITFRTEIIGSINDYLSMSFQFVAIYDDDFSEQLQIKQVLAAGLSFTLL